MGDIQAVRHAPQPWIPNGTLLSSVSGSVILHFTVSPYSTLWWMASGPGELLTTNLLGLTFLRYLHQNHLVSSGDSRVIST